MKKLLILNDEIDDIMKIIKYFEDSGLQIQGISKKIKNVAKQQIDQFLSKLFGTLPV